MVIAATSTTAAPSPTNMRSASTAQAGIAPSSASTMATSGACSSTETPGTDTETSPIAVVTSTTSPMPTKRLRGRVFPGSRASAARFATVSRPV